MKTEYKNKQINLRLTEKEYYNLKEKSVNYPTLSSYILDACMNFDDSLGIKRLHIIRNWCDDFKNYENNLIRIGGNINQIAHYLNKLSSTGVLSYEFVPELSKQYNDLIDLLTQINSSNMNFKKNVSDFMTRKKR